MASSAATAGAEHSIQIMPGAPASVTTAVAAKGADAADGESRPRESATIVPPPAGPVDTNAHDGDFSEPEKKLNLFVRVLATGELVGDGLGKLASLWATFILLGGYRKSLKHVDFWIATAMVFLEAIRVFIRNFKLDSQSLFGSTKAFRWINSTFASMLWRPQEGDESVLIIRVVMAIFDPLQNIVALSLTVVLSRIPLRETMMRQLQRRRSKPLLTLLVIPLANIAATFKGPWLTYPQMPLVQALLYTLDDLMQVVALVLLYFRPRRITTLISRPWGQTLLYVSKVISALLIAFFPWRFLSAFYTVVLLLGSLQDAAVPNSLFTRSIDGIMHIFFLFCVAFNLRVYFSVRGAISTIALLAVLLIGNLQIPATVAQIALSSWRLATSHHHGDSANMVASIKVFYALVLCQGSLYIMACIIAFFSVVPRRWLARRSGFGDDWGARAVDLYYERAYTKRIEIGVFADDTISLASFVVDSLNSASSISRELHFSASKARELQLAGVRVLHSLLQQKGSSNEELISMITRSEKAVPTLISMLDWTFKQDKDIRLFAAKATADLASYLKIAGNAGAVRSISSLLDAAENQPSNDEGNGNDGSSLGPPQPADGDNEGGGNTRNEQGRNCCPWWCSWVCKCWQCMKKNWPWWSLEKKSINSMQAHSLPVLGMMILERLACDPDNCAEIVKNTNLITKIIGLISYTSNDRSRNDNVLIISSSLNFVRMIATTIGKVGATLWQDLWESPLLLSNLTCVLQDCRSSLEVWKPAIDVIATLALDEVARHELGRVQVIIHNLLHIFIIEQDGPTNYDQLLRVAAGAALANLAMENPENCLAMLEERQVCGYDLVKDLEGMLGNNEYRCVAASLLLNLCECSRMRDALPETFAECSRIKEQVSDPEVSNQLSAALRVLSLSIAAETFDECSRIKGWLSDTRVRTQLSSALRLVLQNIMAAENKQLEALIGLASQICYVLPPRRFVQGLESHVIEPTIVQKLVNTLNSNKKPSHEYPRMRRAIVDMVISVLRHSPGDSIIFRTEGGMVDALSKVETTPSKVEKYRVFLSKEGVVLEHGLPLRDLVATAKGLIHHATPT